jgi:hypothetical protein
MVGPTTFGYQNLGFGAGAATADLGKLELLQTQTISSATANFTSLDVSTYNVHLFTLSDLVVTTQTEFGLRVSDDGGSTYETTNYEFANQRGYATGTFAFRTSQSQASIRLGGDVTTDTNSVFNGYVYMYNAGDSSLLTRFTSHCTFTQGSTYTMEFGASIYNQASTINAIQFGEGILGAFSSGTISAYGISESS